MRKKIRSRLAREHTGPPTATRYQPGEPLSDAQMRNLQFRDDTRGSDGRAVFASDEERRAAWTEHRHRFLAVTVLGRRCAAFWSYEPDVPEELRAFPPVTAYRSLEEAVSAHGQLAESRLAWLLKHPGHHRAGERVALQELLTPPAPAQGA
jgi:hypothetical protein